MSTLFSQIFLKSNNEITKLQRERDEGNMNSNTKKGIKQFAL